MAIALPRQRGGIQRAYAALLYPPLVIAGAVGAIWYPLPSLAAVTALTGFSMLGRDVVERLPRVFAIVLGVVLAGYAFLGRGFAHLGVPPIYVGEIALAIGAVALVFTGRIRRALEAPAAWIILLLALWGALRTVPYIDRYGLDALRDATLWGYSAFALIVAGLSGRASLRGAVLVYRRAVPYFLLAVPVMSWIFIRFASGLPVVPGSHGITILFVKFGDIGVHLAGVGAFLGAGLYERLTTKPSRPMAWVNWTLFALGTAIVFSLSRSGLVSVAFALFVVFLARPWGAFWRLVPIGFAGLVLLVSLGHTGFSSRWERSISTTQIVDNVMSILDSSARTDGLGDNVRWRFRWWNRIAKDTAFGAERFTGRGYGVNLAKVDGFLGDAEADQKLRSPHSAHMNFLARGGLPGLGIWVGFIVVFAGLQIGAYRRARAGGNETLARVILFLLAYWSAFLVNASFDVYLEGPQGGIWFWCVTGIAMAAIVVARRETAPAPSRV